MKIINNKMKKIMKMKIKINNNIFNPRNINKIMEINIKNKNNFNLQKMKEKT